jgi:hypothetical protein
MRRITTAFAAGAAAVLLTSTLAAAQGQVTDNRLTNVTFSAPVTVPGHTLQAGTYHFQLLDSQTDRNIVQIFDKDNHIVATLMAIPAKRPQPEGDPVITFKEARADMPPAVHYWYYAGESSGSELVYPKSQAMQIAQASGESVMSTDTDSSEASALKSSKITRVSPDNANAQPATQPDTTTAPQQSTQPTSTPVTTAPTTPTTTTPTTTAESNPPATAPTTSTTTAEQRTRPTTTAEQPTHPTTTTAKSDENTTQPQTVGTAGRRASARKSLPKTASTLPEIGLIGLIALSAGLGMRAARKALL